MKNSYICQNYKRKHAKTVSNGTSATDSILLNCWLYSQRTVFSRNLLVCTNRHGNRLPMSTERAKPSHIELWTNNPFGNQSNLFLPGPLCFMHFLFLHWLHVIRSVRVVKLFLIIHSLTLRVYILDNNIYFVIKDHYIYVTYYPR